MANALAFIVLFCIELTGIHCNEADSRVVKLTQGSIRGYKDPNFNFYAFNGIPYARAPTGNDKFKAPLPPAPWDGIFEAINNRTVCPQNKGFLKQYNFTYADIKEDCLVANVYLPNTTKENLPVLVTVHGGGYQIGFGDMIKPKSLAEQDVIVVNFNYRLGAHGFLCLGTEKAPGNAGLKDILALLQWISSNIQSFGGNPKDVTLSGFSAGSSAADLLGLSKKTEGLFDKLILESGNAVASWSIQMDSIKNAQTFLNKFNFTSEKIEDMEAFFTNASYDDLMSETFFGNKDSSFTFVPCLENSGNEEAIITTPPIDIIKAGDYRKIPTLLGFTSKEGLFRIDLLPTWKESMNKHFELFLPQDLEHNDKVIQAIRKFYFEDKEIGEQTIQEYVDFFSDLIFLYPAKITAKLRAQSGQKNIFLYEYAFYDSSVANLVSSELAKTIKGPGHGTQTFAVLEPITDGISENYKEMKKLMQALWINFIKTGNPVPEGSSLISEGWPATTSTGFPYMVLDLPPKISYANDTSRLQIWEDAYSKYYKKPIVP